MSEEMAQSANLGPIRFYTKDHIAVSLNFLQVWFLPLDLALRFDSVGPRWKLMKRTL